MSSPFVDKKGTWVSGKIRKRVYSALPELNSAGFDQWGLDPELVSKALTFLEPVYRKYFRVKTVGMENLPQGRVLLVANHGGQIPVDGLLIAMSGILDAEPPRIVRAMVERWVPILPFVSSFFIKVGEILGHPKNCKELLEHDQTVLVFPEGVRGLGKPYAERYRLKRFGSGFARLAVETGTPVVPVAVIGSEESVPALGQWTKLAKLIGAPYVPITPFFPFLGPLGLLPLPTRITLRFGKPIYLQGAKESSEQEIHREVEKVKLALEAEIAIGLKARGSEVFTKAATHRGDVETAESVGRAEPRPENKAESKNDHA